MDMSNQPGSLRKLDILIKRGKLVEDVEDIGDEDPSALAWIGVIRHPVAMEIHHLTWADEEHIPKRRTYYGVSYIGGTQNGGFIGEHPNLKWMMTGGTPILGNLHTMGISWETWDYGIIVDL